MKDKLRYRVYILLIGIVLALLGFWHFKSTDDGSGLATVLGYIIAVVIIFGTLIGYMLYVLKVLHNKSSKPSPTKTNQKPDYIITLVVAALFFYLALFQATDITQPFMLRLSVFITIIGLVRLYGFYSVKSKKLATLNNNTQINIIIFVLIAMSVEAYISLLS